MAQADPTKKPRKRVARKSANARADTSPAADAAEDSSLVAMAKQVRSWSDSALGIAGAAADVSIGAAKALLVRPEQRATLARAGSVLRSMREAAGLSLMEVGEAINLKDPTLLELVEGGKVALPFEVILRLASVLGRNDPISFVMRFTRSYSPDTPRAGVRQHLSRERRGAPPRRRGVHRRARVRQGGVRPRAHVPRQVGSRGPAAQEVTPDTLR